MRKFEIGKTYTVRSICNHECVWSFTVASRTACTVTLVDDQGKTKKLRISKKTSDYLQAESVYPLGNYSMCPILSA